MNNTSTAFINVNFNIYKYVIKINIKVLSTNMNKQWTAGVQLTTITLTKINKLTLL